MSVTIIQGNRKEWKLKKRKLKYEDGKGSKLTNVTVTLTVKLIVAEEFGYLPWTEDKGSKRWKLLD